MKVPPLFMLNIPDRVRKRAGAGVLFPVSVKGRTVVLATAAHSLTGLVGKYEMILTDANGHELPHTKTPVKTMILPPALSTDLAILDTREDL